MQIRINSCLYKQPLIRGVLLNLEQSMSSSRWIRYHLYEPGEFIKDKKRGEKQTRENIENIVLVAHVSMCPPLMGERPLHYDKQECDHWNPVDHKIRETYVPMTHSIIKSMRPVLQFPPPGVDRSIAMQINIVDEQLRLNGPPNDP